MSAKVIPHPCPLPQGEGFVLYPSPARGRGEYRGGNGRQPFPQYSVMPELPDVAIYVEHLAARIVDQRLEHIRLMNPFLLRTVEPPIAAVEGLRVIGVRRLGKR